DLERPAGRAGLHAGRRKPATHRPARGARRYQRQRLAALDLRCVRLHDHTAGRVPVLAAVLCSRTSGRWRKGVSHLVWWRDAVISRLSPRRFADWEGDGRGDLRGVTSRLDHLVELGVDAVWLSPFYRSPQADAGYDVADYRDVDPRFGTLADFDALAAAARRRGIRVLIDLVPNHTSVAHRWFQDALVAGPRSPDLASAARDRYHFRKGSGPDGDQPPNGWQSVFGGPAWKRVEDGQWYLHLFDASQPDLNWDHPEVRAEFEDILRFWLDRGVA